MVTVATAYGSHPTPISYRVAEPPGVTEVRAAFENVLMAAFREFANQSVQATALGIKALDAGDYVTLDELEALILKQ